VHAQTVVTRIVADPSAPGAQRPTVLTTSNGLVQVNIRTPSAAGVSRNTYSQFDVGAAGAVLNNSRTPVQTQQGGWVQGNPWLATGSARVILNVVNSNNPSYLQGYVEVAGQRAQVIIANPSGIAINGGGFINAGAAILTTGTPIMNAGALESFRVEGGQMTIEGQGLDARSTDYTAILSRALQVNAGIWAQQLQVVTGTNHIAAASLSADTTVQSTPLASTANPPSYALDVAALGGMYARKIHLIGTEAGVGVRNAGLLQASSGPLTLNHQGWLSNSGTLQASGGDVVVQTQGTMVQSGTVYSDHNVQLNSQGSQTHSGVVAALGSVQIQAKDASTSTNTGSAAPQILASSHTIWAAGMRADGSLNTLSAGETKGGQTLRVSADGLLQTEGQALATQTLSLQAASLDVSQSRQQAPSIYMQATTGDLQATGGSIQASENLHMQTNQTLITDRAQLQADSLTLQAHALSNVAGQITQTGQADQSLALQGQLNNTSGTIYSAARHLKIRAQGVDNTAGQILHAGKGTLSIDSQGDLINTEQSNTQPAVIDGARIIGSGAVQVSAQILTNSGNIYAAQDLSSTVKSLANSGSLYAAGAQTLTATEGLQSSGTIAAAKDLHINAASVAGTSTNVLAAGMAADGQLSGTGALTMNITGVLQNAGQVLSTNGMSLDASALNLAGSQTGTTAGDVSLTASSGDINTRQAQLSTPGKLNITANNQESQKLNNSEGQISAQQLNIQVGQLINDHGAIEQTGTGTQTASIETAGVLDNTGGSILANAQNFTLNASSKLDNTDGQIGHAGAGIFSLGSGTGANTRGKVLGNGSLVWAATGDLNNTSGLVAAQILDIAATGLNNSQGQLLSTQANVGLRINQNGINNNSGLIQSAQDLSLNLTGDRNSLSNSQGKIYAGRDAELATGALNNDAALIAAGRHLSIDTHDQSLSNQGTRSGSSTAPLGLIAGAQMDISSGALDNTGGLISSQMALDITSTDTIKNAANHGQSGLIYSGTNLNLQANGVDNTSGQILSVQNASLQTGSGSLTNTRGLVRVGQTLTLQAGSVDNSGTRAFDPDGTPQAMGLEGNAVAISTAALNNTQGAVRAAQDLSVDSDGQLSNEQGELSAGRKLQITTAQTTPTLRISNQAGQIVADQSVNVRTGSLSGAGTIASEGDVNLSLQGDHTLAGTLQAGGSLSLSATGRITNPVSVQAGKNLHISANELDNQATGEFLSGQTTSVQVANTFTNRGLIDGGDTRIQAGTVNNLGTGRIYGDRVAIAASTLTNQEETLLGITKAATIAGRERVDIGVQTLTNQENALIYSGGDMAIGGTLDSSWRAIDNAQVVNNRSATIEAAQNITIQALTLRNTNEHLNYTLLGNVEWLEDYYTWQGLISSKDVSWRTGNGIFLGMTGSGRLVLATHQYGDVKYQAVYGGGSAYVPEHKASVGSGDSLSEITVPESFAYGPKDAVWGVMGVKAPTIETPGSPPERVCQYVSESSTVCTRPEPAYSDWWAKAKPLSW
jgi:filamentous hemagglutinin